MFAEGRHLLANFAEILIAWLQALHPQADFVNQSRGPATPQDQAVIGLPTAVERPAPLDGHAEVAAVRIQEMFQGPPIGLDPPQQAPGHARIAAAQYRRLVRSARGP